MACEHLRELYRLCQEQKIRLGGLDLVHIVCTQCNKKDVCPTDLFLPIDEDPQREESDRRAEHSSDVDAVSRD
ncbi:MAG: hypothetical protein D6725_10665 [Planctomycetota bacterium]|nr:MAG: hypothetical protein D6725_10665 [Planctomycetota bacterium]